MQELDPAVFVAVFQEMLGWLFWPLVALILLGAAAFVALLVRDRGFDSRRLVRAELVGILGGFFGVWLMLTVTSSRLADIGGPIDWVLTILTWVVGAVGATILAYILSSLAGGRDRSQAA